MALAVACEVADARALAADETSPPPPHTDDTAVATADALLDAASLKAWEFACEIELTLLPASIRGVSLIVTRVIRGVTIVHSWSDLNDGLDIWELRTRGHSQLIECLLCSWSPAGAHVGSDGQISVTLQKYGLQTYDPLAGILLLTLCCRLCYAQAGQRQELTADGGFQHHG